MVMIQQFCDTWYCREKQQLLNPSLFPTQSEFRVTDSTNLSCPSFHCKSALRFKEILLKGPYQCSYMSFSVVNTDHIGHINPAHFSPSNFIYEIWCFFTFCPYSINVTESSWKCVTTLLKKKVCVKILLHADIRAGKAALFFTIFPSVITFMSLPHSAIFDQINADVLFRRVNYLYLATFTCPVMFLYPVSTWMVVNGL